MDRGEEDDVEWSVIDTTKVGGVGWTVLVRKTRTGEEDEGTLTGRTSRKET